MWSLIFIWPKTCNEIEDCLFFQCTLNCRHLLYSQVFSLFSWWVFLHAGWGFVAVLLEIGCGHSKIVIEWLETNFTSRIMESIGNSPFISCSYFILLSSYNDDLSVFTLWLLPLGSGPNCREWWLAERGWDGRLSFWPCKCNPRNWWGHELRRDA